MINSLRVLSLFILSVWSVSVLAYDSASLQPQYLWLHNTDTQNGARGLFQVGLLNGDNAATDEEGALLMLDAQTTYALSEQTGLYLSLPLLGTISSGPDGFALGNISLGVKHFFANEHSFIFGLALELAAATATNDAAIGGATRKFYRYANDQWAVVPEVVVGTQQDAYQIMANIGLPIQLWNDDASPEGDGIETYISYDLGFASAISTTRDYWLTMELGGYSSISFDNIDNQTELFGKVGLQYRDDEKHLGFGISAPFTDTPRSQIQVMMYVDASIGF